MTDAPTPTAVMADALAEQYPDGSAAAFDIHAEEGEPCAIEATRMAAGGSYVHHSLSNSSTTTINGGVNVHTAATDAKGIAADIEPHLRRSDRAGRADYGLA